MELIIRRINLIFNFYRRSIVMAAITTLLVLWFMGEGNFAVAFCTKAGVSAGFIAITHFTYPREYRYYRNLGVRPGALWAGSFAMDMVVFLLIFIPVRVILQ